MKLHRHIHLLVALAVPAYGADITWNTAGPDNDWNTSSLNWTGGATFFTSGDNVTFDNATGETVTVDAGGVSAGTIAVGVNNGSWTFSGGSITSSGALTKSGTGSLTLNNANAFSSVVVNAGPYAQSNAALRINNASALGSAPVTLANTGNMTAFYFQTGFAALGSSGTFSNDVAFSSTSGITTRITQAATAPANPTQTAIMSGLLTGGHSGSEIRIESDTGSAHSVLRLTNASNSVAASRWHVNRGQLQVTSDAALGNANNDIRMDLGVSGDPELTGFGFAANNIVLNANRDFIIQSRSVVNTFNNTGSQINGAVTFTGQMVKKGSTILTLNAAGSGAGGARIDAGSISIGNAAALGTGAITFNTTGNAMLRTNALSGAVTLANNIVLNNPAAAGNLGILIKAGGGNSLQINGVISGGGANTTLFLDTDVGGDVTGKFILNNTNTYSGKTYINRGSVQLNNAAGFGTSAVQFDSSPNAVLSFNSPMTVSNSISYTFGTKKIDTGANDVTLSGVQNLSTAISKEGSGKLTLTNTNTGTATTTINQGTLALSGSGSLASNSIDVGASTTFDVSAVTGGWQLGLAQTLTGVGTVAGAATIHGKHAAGLAGIGTQSFTSDLSYESGAIFEWDLNANADGDGADGDDGIAGTDFDSVAVTGNLNGSSGSIFRVIFGATAKAGIEDSGNAFWNTPYGTQVWNMAALFGKAFTTGGFTSVQTYDSNGLYDVSSKGEFTINGSSLTWTAIPEPTSALAGLLISLGLLRRRR